MSQSDLPQGRSLVIDVYAPIIRPAGGWIAIADLVAVLGALDMEEPAVRSSVSRLRAKGFLEREARDGAVGYGLTDEAMAILAEGDERLYGNLAPATVEDGWVLIAFSVPEESRADRHQLRRRLTWIGFGTLGNGLWIAPGRVLERTMTMLEQQALSRYVDVFDATYLGFDDLSRLITRCWDIDRMRKSYAAFETHFAPMVDRWADRDPDANWEAAFRDFIAAAHEWRQLPYLDPGLPPSLLPEGWEGRTAGNVFDHLNARLLPAAQAYVEDLRTA